MTKKEIKQKLNRLYDLQVAEAIKITKYGFLLNLSNESITEDLERLRLKQKTIIESAAALNIDLSRTLSDRRQVECWRRCENLDKVQQDLYEGRS